MARPYKPGCPEGGGVCEKLTYINEGLPGKGKPSF